MQLFLYCGFFRFSPHSVVGGGGRSFEIQLLLDSSLFFISWHQSPSYASLLILRIGFCLLQFKFSGNASIFIHLHFQLFLPFLEDKYSTSSIILLFLISKNQRLFKDGISPLSFYACFLSIGKLVLHCSSSSQ